MHHRIGQKLDLPPNTTSKFASSEYADLLRKELNYLNPNRDLAGSSTPESSSFILSWVTSALFAVSRVVGVLPATIVHNPASGSPQMQLSRQWTNYAIFVCFFLLGVTTYSAIDLMLGNFVFGSDFSGVMLSGGVYAEVQFAVMVQTTSLAKRLDMVRAVNYIDRYERKFPFIQSENTRNIMYVILLERFAYVFVTALYAQVYKSYLSLINTSSTSVLMAFILVNIPMFENGIIFGNLVLLLTGQFHDVDVEILKLCEVPSRQLSKEQMILYFAHVFGQSTLRLYFAIQRQDPEFSPLSGTAGIGYAGWCFLFVTPCEVALRQAHSLFGTVNQVLTRTDLSLEARTELQEFSEQLMQLPIRFKAAGFISIDYTLMQAMVASITTYLVIMLQVQFS